MFFAVRTKYHFAFGIFAPLGIPGENKMSLLQGVPTSLGQAKCNILKLRSLPAKITNVTKTCILLHKIAF